MTETKEQEIKEAEYGRTLCGSITLVLLFIFVPVTLILDNFWFGICNLAALVYFFIVTFYHHANLKKLTVTEESNIK